jgi:Peptidase propeptide and YPEB domain
MRSILFATCAAIVLATGAFSASADDNRYYNDGYYNDGGYQYQYRDRGYYQPAPDYSNTAYGQPIPPHWIVRNLERSGYSYISRPVLSGRFYQMKAVNPDGHKVKLYIDAYTGQIVKVKG